MTAESAALREPLIGPRVFGPQPEHLAGPPDPSPGSPPGSSRRRTRVLVAALASVAVLGLAAVAPVLAPGLGGGPVDRTLERVQVFTGTPRDHTPDDVTYAAVPPMGGPHDPEWLDCGAYGTPVRDENAVHDLEHGTVWITYDPSLPEADVASLVRVLPDNGILSPYDGLPAPVVVTVWERQLRLTGADDPRLPLFLAGFGDGHTAPEPFASCAGGASSGGQGPSTPV